MSAALKQTEVVAKAAADGTANTVSTMTVAIWVSIAVHAVLLTIHFQPELKKMADHLPSLNVVLVNAKTKTAPDKAELLAQANLDRGGNTDENRKMKTALPAPKEKSAEVNLKPNAEARTSAKSAKLKAQEAREQKRVEELERQAQELMTQLNSAKKIQSNPTQKAAAAEPEIGDQKSKNKTKIFDPAEMAAKALEIEKLEAEIAKNTEIYQTRPKKRFLGSRAKAISDALYLEAWRQKVERVGNLNYPEAAKNNKIYGQLQMTVEIKSDGTIASIEINKSSGSKILDDAAKSIVSLAAPYARFPPEMKKTTDILGITRTWTFTQEDTIATKGSD